MRWWKWQTLSKSGTLCCSSISCCNYVLSLWSSDVTCSHGIKQCSNENLHNIDNQSVIRSMFLCSVTNMPQRALVSSKDLMKTRSNSHNSFGTFQSFA